MSMLVPARANAPRSLFNTLMNDPFEAFFDTPARTTSPTLMRTDIRETPEGFELTVDLPGFKKENVTAELKDGYLSISARTQTEATSEGDKGTWLRKERFSGTCSRSFYVGEEIVEEDIRARFEDGLLKIAVPKKQPAPKLEEKRVIAIEG
ncbi:MULTISPECIES: Hsp20/alpha crystallin family protein [unclassified Adlercreutzia]|uniref:Hsp20/alpha crystallin family protein n=1 Tax=unclassified Adlercreutzia TaxID=2636013 RepID=UPI0013EBB70A|nr:MULTISPECIES: Hsp20/alpha crystallin family protein [unclassified Adlercreutzia]